MRHGTRLGVDPGDARIGVARSDPHGILATRREVLGHLLAELGDPRVGLDQRHVTVWPCRIHLATAPVTRDGEQVEVTPARHDLWAPPDPLVNRILGTVVALRDA